MVHAPNPATRLTLAQIAYLCNGKNIDWMQVGGTDQAMTGGTRAMVKKVMMGGTAYASSVKSPASVARIAELIPSCDRGSGDLGQGFARNRWQVEACGDPQDPTAACDCHDGRALGEGKTDGRRVYAVVGK